MLLCRDSLSRFIPDAFPADALTAQSMWEIGTAPLAA
jgi:hypothetical protein